MEFKSPLLGGKRVGSALNGLCEQMHRLDEICTVFRRPRFPSMASLQFLESGVKNVMVSTLNKLAGWRHSRWIWRLRFITGWNLCPDGRDPCDDRKSNGSSSGSLLKFLHLKEICADTRFRTSFKKKQTARENLLTLTEFSYTENIKRVYQILFCDSTHGGPRLNSSAVENLQSGILDSSELRSLALWTTLGIFVVFSLEWWVEPSIDLSASAYFCVTS